MTMDGFTAEDFDAYQPVKWGSNMYTLQRRKVKEKLAELGKEIQASLDHQDLPLVPHFSDEYPSLWNKKQVSSQWLFFSRDLSAQQELSDIIDTEKTLSATLEDPTPLYRHVFIGVSVDEQGVEVGVRLHYDAWVDRKNLLSILNDKERQVRFCELICSLDGGQVGNPDAPLEATELSPASLEGILEAFVANKGWFFVGKRFLRGDVVQGASVMSALLDWGRRLFDVYRFVAWSLANDAVSIDAILQQKHEEQAAAHRRLEEEKQARAQEHDQIVAARQEKQERQKEDLLDAQAWRERERAKRRAAAAARREAAEAAWHKMKGEGRNFETEGATEARKTPPSENAADTASGDRSVSLSSTSNNKVDNRESRLGRFRSAGHGGTDRQSGKSGKTGPRFDKKRKTHATVSDARKADIRVGDRVTVVQGLLQGKAGVVQTIDDKGDLKVSFGMLSSRVSRNDVKGLGPTG